MRCAICGQAKASDDSTDRLAAPRRTCEVKVPMSGCSSAATAALPASVSMCVTLSTPRLLMHTWVGGAGAKGKAGGRRITR